MKYIDKRTRRSLREDNNVFVWDGKSAVPNDVEHVRIADGVTTIGYSAFYRRVKLTSVTIPDSVASIENWAFATCRSLTSVTLPDSVTSIGDYAFYDCENLTSVTIGKSVKSIGFSTFCHCTSLTSVTIPDSVEDIGKNAFRSCTALTSVTIGSSVTSIGEGAFYGCDNLHRLTPSKFIQTYPRAFEPYDITYSDTEAEDEEDDVDDTYSTDDIEARGDEFYRSAEQELEKHFNCTGAYLEPSTQGGVGGVFLFADDMTFDGSFDFETGEEYIYEDDFDGFLRLCLNSFKPRAAESYTSRDIFEMLDRAHELDEAAAGVATKRAGTIPGTIYKVMIKGADEFLLTERLTDIQAYLSNYAAGCPSFNAVIYTMTNFRFKDIPYLYYEGGSYLNIDFSDSTAQSVVYVDGECKTQLNSENYSTPARSHLSDYTVRLRNTVTDFNDSLLVSPRLERFKYKVVIDSVIHLFDTEQEAQDYYDEYPSSRRLGNNFESFSRV